MMEKPLTYPEYFNIACETIVEIEEWLPQNATKVDEVFKKKFVDLSVFIEGLKKLSREDLQIMGFSKEQRIMLDNISIINSYLLNKITIMHRINKLEYLFDYLKEVMMSDTDIRSKMFCKTDHSTQFEELPFFTAILAIGECEEFPLLLSIIKKNPLLMEELNARLPINMRNEKTGEKFLELINERHEHRDFFKLVRIEVKKELIKSKLEKNKNKAKEPCTPKEYLERMEKFFPRRKILLFK